MRQDVVAREGGRMNERCTGLGDKFATNENMHV